MDHRQNIAAALSGFNAAAIHAASAIFDAAKADATTYGEAASIIKRYRQGARWDGDNLSQAVFDLAEKLLEDEKSRLPVTSGPASLNSLD